MKRDLKSMGSRKMNNSENDKENTNSDISKIRKKAEELSKLDENRLMEELFKSVDEAKKNGEFSEEKVSGFMSKVSPMLSNEQREKMSSLLNKLK